MKNYLFSFICVLFLGLYTACTSQPQPRAHLSLEGIWGLQLDSLDVGMAANWAQTTFADSLSLPGTTDVARKGVYNTDHSNTTALSRAYTYVGKAWYKKEVMIPADWSGKEIVLVLERTKPTDVWVDGQYVGKNDNVSTAQVYDLSKYMTPGSHQLVIRVDNGESVPPQVITSSHAYTESTQTNWNGIIGALYLEARAPLHLADIRVTPRLAGKKVEVKIHIAHPEQITEGMAVRLEASAWNTDKKHQVRAATYPLQKGEGQYTFDYALGEEALFWSAFDPALYQLKVSLEDYDYQEVTFGLREFGVRGTQFVINDQLTFLRGKHDACVFPLTAHVAMDVDAWRHYFQVCKSYGINHCRFHSWCPPRACFEAADIEGIYLQPELPFWGSLHQDDERLTTFLHKEGVNIQQAYGNHASFVLFALGNELSGDLEVMESLTRSFRAVDDRHLYAYGSNNYLGFRGQIPGEDFLVTCRIGGAEWESFRTHTRGSFSFADAYDGGYLNHTYPNSVMNFDSAVAGCSVPVISHETGQFQVYPNYKEMEKYTGVLRPDNMEIFRKRLEEAGMLDQADDFFKASGRWSALLYKADIEMDLRTKGFGGFQLLDLQDYPGQGSAYVGILDAFMDNKGHITPEEWREFCNDVVPLFVTEKFCLTHDEALSGKILIADYSPAALTGKTVDWRLTGADGEMIDQGQLPIERTEKGLVEVGNINPQISSVKKAAKVTLEIAIADTDYRNHYPLWIYPARTEIQIPEEITLTRALDAPAIAALRKGGKVLWFPRKEQMKHLTVGALFQTDYWNYRMFSSICERIGKPVSPGTMGLLIEPRHPLFDDFPTDYHTHWQWFPIIKESYPMILDRMPADYRPIVQVIDNIERNHKLGLVFELSVEGGKLLVCMSDLEAVEDKPEARQFYKSLINYMQSDAFAPSTSMDFASVQDLFSKGVQTGKIAVLENISY
ncbi:sugar-binding domain-containing protein [Parabacteroides sp. PF5-6]|uniref:sugar-binding domain-containing protein n=1 Tax=Parabacteroides sp. PF5-6 TaxID=1742403 RepID=UPI002406384F|nr:sugar-binding domain-containing protein [Parabacteroides sp. PF5-6]